MNIVRIRPFGLSISRAEYYGYRLGMHLGWWLVFILPIKEGEE